MVRLFPVALFARLLAWRQGLCGCNLFSRDRCTLIAVRWFPCLLIPLALAAADWTQFRGPNGSGVSPSKGLPEHFGPQKNILWRTALPRGHSSPVLTKDRIFVTAFEGKSLLTICLDRDSGKVLWRR